MNRNDLDGLRRHPGLRHSVEGKPYERMGWRKRITRVARGCRHRGRSIRCAHESPKQAIWFGSATGATTNVQRRYANFFFRPEQRRRIGRLESMVSVTRRSGIDELNDSGHGVRRLAREFRSPAACLRNLGRRFTYRRRPYTQDTSRNSHHSSIRGACLRHPADFRPVARHRRPVSSRYKIPDGAKQQEMRP